MIGCLKVSIFRVFGCVSLVSSLAWIALEPKNHSIEIRNIILNPSTFHFHHFFVFHRVPPVNFPGFVLRIWMECETAVAPFQLASQHPRPRQMPLTGQYGRQGWDPHVVDTIRPQMPGYRAFFPGKKLLAWRDGDIKDPPKDPLVSELWRVWGSLFVKSTWKIWRYEYYISVLIFWW